MKKPPVRLELEWSEAANLLLGAGRADTSTWTPAARGAFTRALSKLAAAVPDITADPGAFVMIVQGQHTRPDPTPAPPQLVAELETCRERRARQPRSPRSYRRSTGRNREPV